jgi:hypothetical protein
MTQKQKSLVEAICLGLQHKFPGCNYSIKRRSDGWIEMRVYIPETWAIEEICNWRDSFWQDRGTLHIQMAVEHKSGE